jgi:hypothetical protein
MIPRSAPLNGASERRLRIRLLRTAYNIVGVLINRTRQGLGTIHFLGTIINAL